MAEALVVGPTPHKDRGVSRTLPTPVSPNKLRYWLEGYDERERATLLKGFRDGFDIGYFGQARETVCQNLSSANDLPVVIDEKLQKEIQHGRIIMWPL